MVRAISLEDGVTSITIKPLVEGVVEVSIEQPRLTPTIYGHFTVAGLNGSLMGTGYKLVKDESQTTAGRLKLLPLGTIIRFTRTDGGSWPTGDFVRTRGKGSPFDYWVQVTTGLILLEIVTKETINSCDFEVMYQP